MDGQQYLDQISPAANKNSKLPKFLSNTMGKVITLGVGAIVAFVIILMIGAGISGGKKDLTSQIFSLKADLNIIAEVTDTHKDDVKSSDLRTSVASFTLNLDSLVKKFDDYLINAYPKEDPNAGEPSAYIAAIGDDLHVAAIGQNFDAAYTRKITIAIDDMNAELYDIYISTKDDELKNVLAEIQKSLLTFYDQFNNYSE